MTSLLLDQSILPGFSGNQSGRTCIPGDKLYVAADGYHAGSGCYEFHGAIYASLAGFVYVFNPKSDDSKFNIVEIRKNLDQKSSVIPNQGNIVTARVEAVTLKFAKCSIICVEDSLLTHEFNSTLKKEDVKEKDKDNVEIYRCVQPGDIIIARVLGYGDSQTAYLLSIAEENLGVISARGLNNERLVPFNSFAVKSTNSDYKEERKVAVIPNSFIDL